MKISDLEPCARCGGKLPPIWHVVRVSMATVTPEIATESNPEKAVIISGDDRTEWMNEFFLCHCCYVSGPLDLAMLSEVSGTALVRTRLS